MTRTTGLLLYIRHQTVDNNLLTERLHNTVRIHCQQQKCSAETLVSGDISFMGFPEERASKRETVFTALTHAVHSFTDVYKISNVQEYLCWK